MDEVLDREQLMAKTMAMFEAARTRGFRAGASTVIVNVLESRFGEVPADLASVIGKLQPAWLDALSRHVADLESLEVTAGILRLIQADPIQTEP